jgi:DNA-binding LytR/AlgR family response regulator
MMEAEMIAEFNLLDGNLVSINMDQVDYFQPSDDGTLVVFSDGRTLELMDSYDFVAEVLNPERQAGL